MMPIKLMTAVMIYLVSVSAFSADSSTEDKCLVEKLKSSSPVMTVKHLRTLCEKEAGTKPLDLGLSTEPSAVNERLSNEKSSADNPFAIIPHKPNYFMPFTYNDSPNNDPFEDRDGGLDKAEMKFQLSYKYPVKQDLLVKGSQLYFAYTGLSFWQAYSSEFSSPFRETNHEPEMFMLFPQKWNLLGWDAKVLAVGINHQSNGQTGLLSRSWNRIYTTLVLERHRWVVSIKPWYRIPEDRKEDITDSKGDDNPDIEDYMGKGEVALFYKHGESTYSMMLRNNLDDLDNRGAVELAWSFPIGKRYAGRLKGYVKYFNGYGESLIDYNSSVNRIGFGIAINDWL